VLSARISAAPAVTHEAILLYWDIGRGIVEKQRTYGWRESVVEMVAADLHKAGNRSVAAIQAAIVTSLPPTSSLPKLTNEP
jgi:hypothetical protein